MNIYSSPEKFNMKIVYEVDCGESYTFDKMVIWKDQKGSLLVGYDAGCSCPCPFEDKGLPDLQPATPEAIREWFEQKRGKTGVDDMQKALALFGPPVTRDEIKNAPSLPSVDEMKKFFGM